MDAYAHEWAEHMDQADTLEHSTGSPYRAEVIASGAPDAETALSLWLGSPAHRDIILDPQYTMVGIGTSGGYWAVVFN